MNQKHVFRMFLDVVWPTYVDPQLPLTKAERKSIHHDAWRMWIKNRWNLILYAALPCVYLILLIPVRDLTGQLALTFGFAATGYRIARVAGMIGLLLTLFVLGGMIFQRYRFAPLVYEATRRRGYDICGKCGYWLRNLSENSSRCPECGENRKPPPPTIEESSNS